MRNTKKKFRLRFMLYPASSKKRYVVACLDLALIREGEDAFKLIQQINKVALKYVESIRKNNLDDALLNQELPKRYIEKYKKIESEMLKRKWEPVINAIVWQKPKAKSACLV